MIPGIFAKTFRCDTVQELFQGIREIGYSHIQFNCSVLGLESMPLQIPENKIQEVREALVQSNLTMTAISGTFNMTHPDKKEILSGLERLKVLARYCRPLGTTTISICTGTKDPVDKWQFHPENNSEQSWNELCHTLGKALQIAEDQEITLAFEPEVANVVNSIEKAKRLIKEMNSPGLKIIFDVANLYEKAELKRIKYLISKGIDLLGEHLIIVHAKGKDATGKFVAAGQGIIPFDHLLKELNQIPYQGPWITHGLKESEAKAVYEFLLTLDL